MESIEAKEAQRLLTTFENKPIYSHVETTSGAYVDHLDQRVFNVGTFSWNIQVIYKRAQLEGGGKNPLHVGLRLCGRGWVYVQGLTYCEIDDNSEFLTAGFNYEGQLVATIEIGEQPFVV